MVNTKETDKNQEAFLMNVGELIEAELIMAKLRAEGIPSIRRHRQAGDYLEVYMNKTIMGIDIYVPLVELERAREIIDTPVEITDEDVFSSGNQELEEREKKNWNTEGRQQVMRWVIVAVLVIAIAVPLIFRFVL